MDSTESPIQLSINQNRFKCVHLSYPKIASFLISNSILSEEQNLTIKKSSTDSVGRMDDLLSLLYQLNSVDAFEQFRLAVIACGQFDLAESLTSGERKFDCLLNLKVQILASVFDYLPKSDLLNVRLVCQSWNDVVTEFYSQSLTLQLKSVRDLVEYIASTSKFCAAVRNFRMSVPTFSVTERDLWTTFCERYGNNVKWLDLTKLHYGIVELIFSEEMQKFFKNLNQLQLNVSLRPSFVANTSLSFLIHLRHLTIVASGNESEYGQMAFLSKFLQLDHKLQSLALRAHFCVGPIPSDIPRNLFRTNTIKSFEVSFQVATFLQDNDFKVMTCKLSKLENIKFTDYFPITPIVLYQFLVANRLTLKRITISSEELLMNNFPTLYCLTHLDGNVKMSSDALSFCTQFPNLKELKLNILDAVKVKQLSHFKHNALRSLCVKAQFIDKWDEMRTFISSCFPNLNELEIKT